MKGHLLRGSAAALILSCSAQTALADLTPQEVWTAWEGYYTDLGYDLKVTQETTGNTLTIQSLEVSQELPDDAGSVTITSGPLDLVSNGDGSVSLRLPDRLPLVVQIDAKDDDEDATVSMELRYENASIVVTGTPAEMTLRSTVSEITGKLVDLVVDGDPMPAGMVRAQVAVTNIVSTLDMQFGDTNGYRQMGSAGMVTYDIGFDSPETEEAGSFKGALRDLRISGAAQLPADVEAADFSQLLNSSATANVHVSYGSGNGDFSGKGDGASFAVTTTSKGGTLGFDLADGQVAYDVTQVEPQVMMQTGDIPFPIAFALKATKFALSVPATPSEEEQPFALGLTLSGFTMPENLWGIFDPGAILPRDPATIIVDLTGKAKVLMDIFAPDFAKTAEQGDATPAELNAVTVNALEVTAAGASLTGKGDFTFDNADKESFGGFPAPEGNADLRLAGANGLIDKLLQMGLMGQQDAMGARMMMGMIGAPTGEPDTLSSHIEINDKGQVFANGQRLK